MLLHGFAGSARSWEPVADHPALAGATCVDLPGHGGRGVAPDETRDPLTWALQVVTDAGGWPRDVVGYSMGGRLALHFAIRFPERVRRLVLESASPGIERDTDRAARRSADRRLAERIVRDGIGAFSDEWDRHPLFADDAVRAPAASARARSIRLDQDARSLAWALRGLGTGALPSLWREIETLAIPVLVIVGELDAKVLDIARAMVALIPDARLEVVAGAGHRVHLSRPDAWVDVVGDFLGARPSEAA